MPRHFHFNLDPYGLSVPTSTRRCFDACATDLITQADADREQDTCASNCCAIEVAQIHAGPATQIDNALEMQRIAQQVRLATAGFWEIRLMTALIALPFVMHVLLIGADTCFKLGLRIPAYPPPFDEWEGTIILWFFGAATVGKGITAIAVGYMARR